jgi:hypothetical protein
MRKKKKVTKDLTIIITIASTMFHTSPLGNTIITINTNKKLVQENEHDQQGDV